MWSCEVYDDGEAEAETVVVLLSSLYPWCIKAMEHDQMNWVGTWGFDFFLVYFSIL